jgi:hypothetical protein
MEEKGLNTLSTGTYMQEGSLRTFCHSSNQGCNFPGCAQGGEGNVEMAWTLRNFFGNAERLQSNASLGHKTSNSFKAAAPLPSLRGSKEPTDCIL